MKPGKSTSHTKKRGSTTNKENADSMRDREQSCPLKRVQNLDAVEERCNLVGASLRTLAMDFFTEHPPEEPE